MFDESVVELDRDESRSGWYTDDADAPDWRDAYEPDFEDGCFDDGVVCDEPLDLYGGDADIMYDA